jgi:hypothetical protein
MTGVPIVNADRMMANARSDSILILCKALAFDWSTVRTLIALRLGPMRSPPATDIEQTQSAFEQMDSLTAQRVLSFWQMRP